jgi:hypothetical protein
MDGGTYRQAPYEAFDEKGYQEMLAIMPKGIDWEHFIENTDNVEGAQTLACTAGGCEV